MKTFNFAIQGRCGDVLERTVEANSIEDALVVVCNECIEEDNTGYFFELENANVEALEKEDNFYRFTIADENYGPVEFGAILDWVKVSE